MDIPGKPPHHSPWLAIIGIALVLHLGLTAYNTLDRIHTKSVMRGRVLGQVAAVDAVVYGLQVDYPKRIYEDPGIKGIAHQQFRAQEYSIEYLKLIIEQQRYLMLLLVEAQ